MVKASCYEGNGVVRKLKNIRDKKSGIISSSYVCAMSYV